MSEVPENLRYSKEHEWVETLETGEVKIGITDFAQHKLADVVYVELPEVGAEVEADQDVAIVESVKATSDIFAPMAGEITQVNEALEETPELINESPFELGWIFCCKPLDPEAGMAELMDAAAYREFIATEG